MRTWAFLFGWVLFIAGCQTARHPESGPPQVVRVLTYNVHHGEGTDGRVDIERIARIIRQSQCDLAAIQEIDVKTGRVPQDEAAELARQTGLHATFAKAIDFRGGEYGQVILSRYPIEETRTLRLPSSAGREQRIAVMVKVVAAGRKIEFVGTHLDAGDAGERTRQVAALFEAFGKSAAFIAGDFNALPSDPAVKPMFERFLEAGGPHPDPTIPSGRPRHKIDCVFYDPSQWRVVSSHVLDEPIASDHRPFLAVLATK